MREKDLTYPDAVISPVADGRHWTFTLTDAAVKLLADVSQAPEASIRTMLIKKAWWVWPGFAITAGKDLDHIVIYLSRAYFDPDKLGCRPMTWLRQLSHECVHIRHRAAFKSQWRYVWSFTWDYIKHLSHDTPREREADEAMGRFDRTDKSKYFLT